MEPEFRKLLPYEYNRTDQAPTATWMFRGAERRVRVPMEFATHDVISRRLLVPAYELGIPDQLVEAAYVRNPQHLCFTVANFPRTIFSQRIIDPDEEPEPRRVLETLLQANTPANPLSLPNVELDADIVAICATHDSLFVVTRERGRIPGASTLQLHSLQPDADLGVRKVNSSTRWQLTFPGNEVPTGPLRIAVSTLPTHDTLFVATRDGRGYVASMDRARGLALDPVPDEAWPEPEGLPALHTPRMGAALDRDTMLVVADGGLGELHAIRGVDRPVAVEVLADSEDRLPRVAAIDAWLYNLRDHFPESVAVDVLVSFLVVASPVARQLWTVSSDEPRLALPLIGGGTIPIFGKVPGNLLELEIGPVDRVVVIPHAGILFGQTATPGWTFLLSPKMIGLLDPAAAPRSAAAAEPDDPRNS